MKSKSFLMIALSILFLSNFGWSEEVNVPADAQKTGILQRHINTAKEMDWDKIIALVMNGADPNIVNIKGKTLLAMLMNKAQQTKKPITYEVNILLKYGANPKLLHEEINTLMYMLIDEASKIGALILNSIDILLKHGADPNYLTKNGYSLLTAVAVSNHQEQQQLIELLLQYGADPSVDNFAVFHIVAQEQLEDLFRYPEFVKAINEKSLLGDTRLHEAVLKTDIEQIKLLLQKGADPFSESDEGQTALDIVKEKRTEMAESFAQYLQGVNEIIKILEEAMKK